MLSQAPAHAEESLAARSERLIAALDAQAELKDVVSPLLARARKALERAKNARRAGDHHHGSELEALSVELAESATDLARVHRTEREVGEIERKAADAETRVVRARALLEQAAARRGRAAERLRQVEAERSAAPAPTSNDKSRPVIPGATDKKTAVRPTPTPGKPKVKPGASK